MFFPFREMRNDEAYQRLSERLKHSKKENPAEVLMTKLNWNSKVQSKQSEAVKEMSKKTFKDLMTTAREWKLKTQRVPTIIKR